MPATLPRPQQDSPQAIRQSIALAFDMIERFEPWHLIGAAGEPAFQNSWVNIGGAAGATAGFRKNIGGTIELKGQMSSPAGAGTGNATVCFTLPEGYRPFTTRKMIGSGTSGISNLLIAAVVVLSTGTVTISLSGIGNNAVVSTFDMEVSFTP